MQAWQVQMASEKSAREDRIIRRDLLARIEAGDTRARQYLPPRRWNSVKSDRGITLHASGILFLECQVVMINPTERNSHRHAYVLWFGTFGTTYLHVYASGLEDALEQCAEWLLEHAPGHIMIECGEEHTALVKEACEEVGLAYPPADGADLDADGYCAAQDSAESDLTRTESGFLTSYEWGISLEDPTVEELYAFVWGD